MVPDLRGHREVELRGLETPGLLHAMRIRSVDPSPAPSNGELPICDNTLRQSGTV